VETPRNAEIGGYETPSLLFIGIRNAWDVVTYIAVEGLAQRKDGNEESKK